MPISTHISDEHLTADTPLALVSGIGKAQLSALRDLGLRTVKDLVFHLPFRYDDFSACVPLSSVSDGQQVTVVAELKRISAKRSFQRRMMMTEALIADDSGELGVIWFRQPFLAKSLQVGKTYRLAGKVSRTRYGLRLASPIVEPSDRVCSVLQPLMPVYPLTSGISQLVMRKLMRRMEKTMAKWLDPLPEEIIKRNELSKLSDALNGIHFPDSWPHSQKARKRLAFDELLRLQVTIAKLRALREKGNAPEVKFSQEVVKDFVAHLPFQLTEDQRRAAWTAIQEMEKGVPMNRLLDGDVGSGKTAVAAVAMVNVAASGYQSALMAPTEILAKQHFQTLTKLFAGRSESTSLWTNSYKFSSVGGREVEYSGKKSVEELRAMIGSGEVSVVIGTHALVEETLSFNALALAVVDEQHRFGVNTRKKLTGKGGLDGLTPHLLSMTATPIPRSLALTFFGDLDISLLLHKPSGRQPIKTQVFLADDGRKKAYEVVRREVESGRQAFVVCPLIEVSDKLGVASVTETFERLQNGELSGLRLGVLHGKLKPNEKDSVMRDFVEGKLDVLVSTSVVEVGVDVPNATVMCIEGAERFGLAQLHQFRGRVGRGGHASHCLLLPSASFDGTDGRLDNFASTDDGFALAELDLKLRGMGDLLGSRQSGFPALKAAKLTDLELVTRAKTEAEILLTAGNLESGELADYLRLEIGDDVHME